MEITAQGDFGPHTQVRITEWIENVPVKDFDGRIIGRAKIGDNGVVQAVIDEAAMSKELFDRLRTGVSTGLSVSTYGEPEVQIFEPPITSEHPNLKYSDEVKRRFDAANAPHKKEL